MEECILSGSLVDVSAGKSLFVEIFESRVWTARQAHQDHRKKNRNNYRTLGEHTSSYLAYEQKVKKTKREKT